MGVLMLAWPLQNRSYPYLKALLAMQAKLFVVCRQNQHVYLKQVGCENQACEPL